MRLDLLLLLATVWSGGSGKAINDEDSVVSVYTTQASVSSTPSLDIYQLIANNVAERITMPILRFFGQHASAHENSNSQHAKPGKQKINLENGDLNSVDLLQDLNELNELSRYATERTEDVTRRRDVEELSEEALKKKYVKPEKIRLNLFSDFPTTSLNEDLRELGEESSTSEPELDDDGPSIISSVISYAWVYLSSLWSVGTAKIQSWFSPNSFRVNQEMSE